MSDGILEQRHFYIQNWRSDVVAVLAPGSPTKGGHQVEEIRYDEYGVPFGVPAGDANADGAVLPDDQAMIASWAAIPLSYDVRGDLDLDGDVDAHDLTLAALESGTMSGMGELSAPKIGNRKGYAGYEFDPALSAAYAFYHVRHRVYNAHLGRWMQRDPLGYFDGPNLYDYGAASPLRFVDPYGLWDWDNGWIEGGLEGGLLTIDNLTGGLIPFIREPADRIRERNATNPWYRWGDRSSALGSALAPFPAAKWRWGTKFVDFMDALPLTANRFVRFGWHRGAARLVFGGEGWWVHWHIFKLYEKGRKRAAWITRFVWEGLVGRKAKSNEDARTHDTPSNSSTDSSDSSALPP